MSSEIISFDKSSYDLSVGLHEDGIWFEMGEFKAHSIELVLSHGEALDLAYALLNALSDHIQSKKAVGA